MTEFELNELINGQTMVLQQCFQVWAVATTSFVVVAYMVGNKLEANLRWMIVVVYALLTISSIGAWCNALYAIRALAQTMIDSGTPPVESMPFVGALVPLGLVVAFLLGTVGSIAYMIKTGKDKNA